MDLLIALTLGILFGVGLFQMLRRNVIRSAIGLIITGNAVNLLLVHCGAYRGTVPAYTTFTQGVPSDPLPQALVLTAIVIGLGGFAFVLGMLYIFSVRYHASDMAQISRLKH